MFAGLALMFTTLLQFVASLIAPYADLIAPHEHHSPYQYDSTESATAGMIGLALLFIGARASSKGRRQLTDAHVVHPQPDRRSSQERTLTPQEQRNEQLNTYVLCPLAILLILLAGALTWRFGDWADPWTALQLLLLDLGVLFVCYAVIHRMREGLRLLAKLRSSTSCSQGVP